MPQISRHIWLSFGAGFASDGWWLPGARIGVRHNLAELHSRSVTWTQYAVAGAGPLMGIQYGNATSFWQTFGKMAFRWGAGAYAGLGSEMRFSQGFGIYGQLELTGYGFTAPLLERKSYLGPSFSFGIMFLP